MSKLERKLEEANKSQAQQQQHQAHIQKEAAHSNYGAHSAAKEHGKVEGHQQQVHPQNQQHQHQQQQQKHQQQHQQQHKQQHQEEIKHAKGTESHQAEADVRKCPSRLGTGACPATSGSQCHDNGCASNRFLCSENPVFNMNCLAECILTELRHGIACHGVGENCLIAIRCAERLYTRLTMMERQVFYPEMQRLVKEAVDELGDCKEPVLFAIDAFFLEHNLLDEMFKLCGQHISNPKVVHSVEFKHFLCSIVELLSRHHKDENMIWEKLNPTNHMDYDHCQELNKKLRNIYISVPEDKPFTGAPSGVGLAFDKIAKFFKGGSSNEPKEVPEKQQDDSKSSKIAASASVNQSHGKK